MSLETSKWATVLERMGHRCYYCGGELETPPEQSILLPKAHFKHPEVEEVSGTLFETDVRKPAVTKRIHELREELKKGLHEFIKRFSLDVLIAENTLSIPLNIPLGLAITEVIAETRIKTIAHHHDFTWERKRFMVSCVSDYLRNAYPPRLHSVVHVVINSTARNQLALRSGANAYLIPNVMDFDNPPAGIDGYNADVRGSAGAGRRRHLRVAADAGGAAQGHRARHRAGEAPGPGRKDDPGDLARLGRRGLRVPGAGQELRRDDGNPRPVRRRTDQPSPRHHGRTAARCTAWTTSTRHADLVTYPSLFEGFGNAFLEAVYHRKPIFVNNYSIYASDIRPKGFRTILMDEYISDRVLAEAKRFLGDADYRQWAVNYNYTEARKHFSYRVLESNLSHILMGFFGLQDPD